MGKVLDKESVREIRRLAAAGAKTKDIALKYEIGYYTVKDIVAGRTWSWVGKTAAEDVEKFGKVRQETKGMWGASAKEEVPFPEEFEVSGEFDMWERRYSWNLCKDEEMRDKLKRIWKGSDEQLAL